MALPPEIITPRDHRHGSKLGDMVRQLMSDNDGQVITAVYAIRNLLKSSGTDLHGLAEHIEKPSNVEKPSNGHGLSEDQMRQIYDAGFHAGVQAAENKIHGVTDFHNADGKPAWEAVALFLQRKKDHLDPRHHQFVDDMASRTAFGREPTEKQHKYLHSLFFKLGGKIA